MGVPIRRIVACQVSKLKPLHPGKLPHNLATLGGRATILGNSKLELCNLARSTHSKDPYTAKPLTRLAYKNVRYRNLCKGLFYKPQRYPSYDEVLGVMQDCNLDRKYDRVKRLGV